MTRLRRSMTLQEYGTPMRAIPESASAPVLNLHKFLIKVKQKEALTKLTEFWNIMHFTIF